MSIMRFRRASRRLLPPCKGEHLEHERTSWHGPISPKGKPLDTHMLGWKNLIHPNTPTMIGWTRNWVWRRSLIQALLWSAIRSAWYTRNRVLGSSPIQALFRSTWDLGYGWGLRDPQCSGPKFFTSNWLLKTWQWYKIFFCKLKRFEEILAPTSIKQRPAMTSARHHRTAGGRSLVRVSKQEADSFAYSN